MRELQASAARRMRAAAQGIGGGLRAATPSEAIETAYAVQAQDPQAAALGLRTRTSGLTREALARALETERSLVRGWFMRGTLYLVPRCEVRPLLALLGPLLLRRSNRRYRELGLDDATLQRAGQVITSALAQEGPLTRAELADRLADAGIDVTGQVPFHLVRRCALLGQVCHGPQRGGEAAFVLLDDWLPAAGGPPAAEETAATLAHRYLAAHAPASVEDFTTWSGLPTSVTRRAWRALADAGRTTEYLVDGQVCALPSDRSPQDAADSGPDVRLLPAYDNYLVGYRNRELSVAAPYEGRVWPGGGQIRATVTVDGRACATWSRGAGGRSVALAPFEDLAPEVLQGVAAEEADVVRFLGS